MIDLFQETLFNPNREIMVPGMIAPWRIAQSEAITLLILSLLITTLNPRVNSSRQYLSQQRAIERALERFVDLNCSK